MSKHQVIVNKFLINLDDINDENEFMKILNKRQRLKEYVDLWEMLHNNKIQEIEIQEAKQENTEIVMKKSAENLKKRKSS